MPSLIGHGLGQLNAFAALISAPHMDRKIGERGGAVDKGIAPGQNFLSRGYESAQGDPGQDGAQANAAHPGVGQLRGSHVATAFPCGQKTPTY